jgi:hypothetical protein
MKTSIPSILAALFASAGISNALDFVTANPKQTATPLSGWTGIVGTRFGVEATDIPAGARVKVTHLGFYAAVAGRFTGAGAVDVEHNVTLNGPRDWNSRNGDFSGLPVAAVVVPIGNPVDANGWSWVELPTPVVLQGGQYYVIAVDNVTNALDPYFDPDVGPPDLTGAATATIVAPGSIFRNGTGTTDAWMIGRWGLASGQEGYPTGGYVGASFQYTLDTAPVIATDLPATTVVAQGGNSTLSVTLNPAGYPDAATYLWEHDDDGTWVQIGTDPTYTIISATVAEAGNYRVTVSNSTGSDQSTGSVVLEPDTDHDGLGDSFETNTGTYVSPIDAGTNPADDDSDDDGLKDGEEVVTIKTNPTIADTDGDGLNDGSEINTHATKPLVADTDADGLPDGAEVNDHTTDPLLVDTDADGVRDGYEVANGSLPTDPASPGGPNPKAIAVRFNNQTGEVTGYGLSPIMYAGAPAVRQKNWNSTVPQTYPALVGTQADIGLPNPGVLVDSAGNPTTMTMNYSAVGAWADDNEDETTYGRLFGPFIFNDNLSRDVNVSLGHIPYASYDVYVYMGAAANGFTGTVTSGAKTFSYTSASGATTAGGLNSYVEATSATDYPQANYCVFRNVAGSSFTFTVSHGNGNAGVFGFQVVESSASAYQTWAANHGLDPQTDGAPGFDKDGDGTLNLLEYAFFTVPTSGTSAPVFTPAIGGGNLGLTYHRNKAATDVTYTAQWSENLADWFSTDLSDTPTGNATADTLEHGITVSQDGDPKKFLRILVSIPGS